MGLTIHYTFRFEGTAAQVRKTLNTLGKTAKKIGFAEVQTGTFQLDYAKSFDEIDKHTPTTINGEIDPDYRWAKIQYEPGSPYMEKDEPDAVYNRRVETWWKNHPQGKHSGFAKHIWFGEGCEPTNIGLIRCGKSKVWTGHAFTKTQYAKDFVKAHLSVCALLKAAEKLGIVEEISDEGEYYETGDLTKLMDNLEGNWKVMKLLADNLGAVVENLGIEGPVTLEGPAARADEELKKFSLG
jgi:hypothetical protein